MACKAKADRATNPVIRIAFLDQIMCSQPNGNFEFWKEDARKIFRSMRNVHSCEEEGPDANIISIMNVRLLLNSSYSRRMASSTSWRCP